jgi:hypothetical protein
MIVEERAESYGRKLGEMRGETDGVVVLLSAEPKWAGADFLQDSYESGDARIVLFRSRADQGVGVVVEEIRIGVGDAG